MAALAEDLAVTEEGTANIPRRVQPDSYADEVSSLEGSGSDFAVINPASLRGVPRTVYHNEVKGDGEGSITGENTEKKGGFFSLSDEQNNLLLLFAITQDDKDKKIDDKIETLGALKQLTQKGGF